MLSQETYLQMKGEVCPVCEKREPMVGATTGDGRRAVRQRTCRHCGSAWEELYTRVGTQLYVLNGYEELYRRNTARREEAISELARVIEADLDVDLQFKNRLIRLLAGSETRKYLFGEGGCDPDGLS